MVDQASTNEEILKKIVSDVRKQSALMRYSFRLTEQNDREILMKDAKKIVEEYVGPGYDVEATCFTDSVNDHILHCKIQVTEIEEK